MTNNNVKKTEKTVSNKRSKSAQNPKIKMRKHNDFLYSVDSDTKPGKAYKVRFRRSGLICDCAGFARLGTKCRHIKGVEDRLGNDYDRILARLGNYEVAADPVQIREVAKDFCPVCNSRNIIRRGRRQCDNYTSQRYYCHECGHRFSDNMGFERYCADSTTITLVLRLHRHLSSRVIQDILDDVYEIKVSHVTVMNWVNTFHALARRYLTRFPPRVGETWHSDEVQVTLRKKRGGKDKEKCDWCAVMDRDTRFILASMVVSKFRQKNADELFRDAKNRAGKRPTEMVTDRGKHYPAAFEKELKHAAPHEKASVHIDDAHIRNQYRNNNIQERLNGEFRSRERLYRGKKGDSKLFDNYEIDHNYIEPLRILDGDTPADRAGIDIESRNKWRTIIENAALHEQKQDSSGEQDDEKVEDEKDSDESISKG